MIIPNAKQIKAWDKETIRLQSIESHDLMENAASAAVNWISANYKEIAKVVVFCGPGNNGGDGLAIARLLSENADLDVHCISPKWPNRSKDNQLNLDRIRALESVHLYEPELQQELPDHSDAEVVIDALLGIGISRPPAGFLLQLIHAINKFKHIISIDIPSGLHPDHYMQGHCVKATHTLTFGAFKLNFCHPEYQQIVGQVHLLQIGLLPIGVMNMTAINHLVEQKDIASNLRKREKFDHKGRFGHAMLVCGSYGKIGAAILAAKACLRSGVGLLSLRTPGVGYSILQQSVPEAMVEPDIHDYYISNMTFSKKFDAYGIGCGLDQKTNTCIALREFLKNCEQPVVLDADAINIIAKTPELLSLIPKNSILTPHFGELKRLIGHWETADHRLELLELITRKYHICLVAKGANTCIQLPDGTRWFNSTGNPGMATAGSGDVLTGMLTSLLAQGYPPGEACKIGVFLHGLAGDLAAEKVGETALIAQDIIDHIGSAYQQVQKSL